MSKSSIAKFTACLGVTAAAVAFGTGEAFAVDAILINSAGTNALGVFDYGNLNVDRDPGNINPRDGGIGVTRIGLGEGTYPGCLCEGWGVSGSGVSGWANRDDGPGFANLVINSFLTDDPGGAAGSGTFATVDTSVSGSPLNVVQDYREADNAPRDLFKNEVTITNTSATDTVTDIRYVRVMDWDIAPTEFSEFVTIQGTATTTLLERSHNNGFEVADPLAADSSIDAVTEDVDFVDYFSASFSGDHGSYFRFNFGDLGPGESVDFTIFYGTARNEVEALASIAAESIELFSLGQSNTVDGPTLGTPGTYIFGFKGVGGKPVFDTIPEPITATLGLISLGALGTATRRRRNA